jgi:DNA repair protein RecO (recombination protein O)
MQWTDSGVVLGVRRHGETSVILELMTSEHGRHLGLVHGGRSKALQPVLQPGNLVQATWRARLDEHLGHFTVEGINLHAARLINSPLGLFGVMSMAHGLRALPERDPHSDLYEAAVSLVEHLLDPDFAPEVFVQFELNLLADLGFGLDLSACAATGTKDDLIYVSPKTGRAVSAAAGEAYKDRLLKLPGFLTAAPRLNRPGVEDLRAGFALTEFFLHQNIWEQRSVPVPPERARFVALVLRAGA